MIKAFTDAITGGWKALKQTITLSSSDGFFGNFGYYGTGDAFSGWSSQSYRKMVEKAAMNPIARRSIDFIGDNLASIPLKLVEVQEDGTTEEQGEHPVLDLLRRPGGPDNLRYTKDWLFKGFTWCLMGGGEFWLRGLAPENGINAGTPRKLELFDRSEFERFIFENRTRMISGYRFNMRRAGRTGEAVETSTEETLHAFTFNPLRKERGLPILLSVMRQLDLMEDADEWNKTVSENKGQIPGFMIPNGLDPTDQLTKQQVKSAQERMNDEMDDARTGRAWKVLSGSFSPKERGITPEEASFIESSKFFGRLIATGLGVDPSLVGDSSSQTYDNYRTALFVAYTTMIIPLLEFCLSALNRHLVPKFEEGGQRLRLTFDPLEIDAIVNVLLAKIESLVEATGGPILAPNEARRLIEFDQFDESAMDELIMKLNKQPHSSFGGADLDVEMSEGIPGKSGDGHPGKDAAIRLVTEGPSVDPRPNP
jgi:phage portal protein BeeE